jgi:uncharacterized protein (UPF0333 family)
MPLDNLYQIKVEYLLSIVVILLILTLTPYPLHFDKLFKGLSFYGYFFQ